MGETSTDLQAKAYEFMLTHRSAALATVSKTGEPHVATVYFAPRKDLSLYFSTKAGGRKYDNMIANPTISMVITHDVDGELASLQLTGKAKRIEDIKDEQRTLFELWRLRYQPGMWPPPPMKMYERGLAPEIAVIKVTPTEMMLANFETTNHRRYRPFFEIVISKRKPRPKRAQRKTSS